jgi:hypothetical protein
MPDTNISRILIIVSASDQHDNDVALFPPIAVMPFMVMAAHSVRVIAAIICFPAPNIVISYVTIPSIVNGWFAVSRIVSGWFPMIGIISDSLITTGIVICCYRLCRLNLWLRKSACPWQLRFRGLLHYSGLAWQCLLSVQRRRCGHEHPNQ